MGLVDSPNKIHSKLQADELELFELLNSEPEYNGAEDIIDVFEEQINECPILDEIRNLSIAYARTGNDKDWRWSPVKIHDWLMGEYFLNLGSTIRKSVYEDITDFFTTEDKNPWSKVYDCAVFCEGIGCHVKGTKVIKYDGSLINIEDVQVGDKLIGDDSKPRNVLRKIQGKELLYKITPIKGEPFIVNKNHILSLIRTNKGKMNAHRKHGGKKDNNAYKITNISVEDYLNKSITFKRLNKLRRTGIEFSYKRTDIDPYFLGIWLGDGSSNIIGITTSDKEIKNYVYRYAKVNKLFVGINQNLNKSCPNYIITGKREKRNHLMDIFRKYNLINNKHIPIQFKRNMREVRLQLLAGLIDSDGYLSKSTMEFSNKNKILCDDVLFLCRSLGFAAYLKERYTTCKGKKFKSYRISISGDLSLIPTKLKRKQAKERRQKKNVLVTGFKIEKLKKGIFYGFELDRNHLYLTEDFIIHHNSGKSFKTSIIATYFQHLLLCLKDPQVYFGIDKSSKIAILNMSISERNAKKVIFSEIMNKINGCKWFQERPWDRDDARMPDPNCQSELRFKNNTFIIPGSSSWRTAVGYNLLVGIIDEAGSYRNTDNGDQCEDIFNALERRIGSRFGSQGAIIMAGSPMFEQDFVESKIKEATTGESTRTLARRRPLWESKYPDWSGEFFYVHKKDKIILEAKPEDMKDVDEIPAVPFLFKAFRNNVTKAYRDFGGQPSATICPFFEVPSIVYERVNKERTEDPVDIYGKFKEWFKPVNPYAFHAVHVDLAITGDACFDGEMEVLDKNFLPYKIKDINIGQKVIVGKDGSIGTVIKKIKKKSKSMCQIIAGNYPIKCTNDHEILCLKKEDISYRGRLVKPNSNDKKIKHKKFKYDELVRYVKAEDLRAGDFLCVPKQDYKKMYDSDLSWLLGIYLAEGDIYTRNNKQCVRFTLNIKEEKIANKIIEISKKYFDKTGYKTRLVRRNTLVVRIHGLGDWFLKRGRKYNHLKQIDNPNVYTLDLVKGFFDGDGYSFFRKYGHEASMKTTSKNLAYQLRMVLIQNDFNPNIYIEEPLGKKIVYKISLRGVDALKFCDINKKTKTAYNFSFGKYSFYRIKTSEIVHQIQDVYDLTILGNYSSYNINGFAVHNCGFSLGHFNGLTEEGGIKVYIDLMMRIKGSRQSPIQISEVREIIYRLTELGFPISIITFDGFQSTDSIQILQKKGYDAQYLSVDRNVLPYNNLKGAINEDRLDYYLVKDKSTLDKSASEYFCLECTTLEDIEGKKVDHAPKSSKDVSDAVCGVVHDIVENADNYGKIRVRTN